MFPMSAVRVFSIESANYVLQLVFTALKLSEVRLRLAEGEANEVERGRHAPHKVSASVFIRMGLELEDQQ